MAWKQDPAAFERANRVHETPEAMREALAGFEEAIVAARLEYGIAHVVVVGALRTENGDEAFAMFRGAADMRTKLAAFGLGLAKRDEKAFIASMVRAGERSTDKPGPSK